MSMRPQLFSISGLAVEFGKDRRTVARLLRDVPADGKSKGHDAWLLSSVTEVLRSTARKRGAGSSEPLPIITAIRDRLDGWEDRGNAPPLLSLAETATMVGESPEVVLQWIRSGCPYAEGGDFRNGDGFQLRLPHVIDWMGLVAFAAHRSGAQDVVRELKL